MKLKQSEDLAIISSTEMKTKDFNIKASREAFQILSSGLYQDKPQAVIRELSTNAYDAHKQLELGVRLADGTFYQEDGASLKPFDVTLPTPLAPHFIVRDYGTGLSEEQMFEIYTTYFGSSKQESNDMIGCLGLGSKSPFSVSSTFTVVSYHGGMRKIYAAMIGADGFPSIIKMHEEPSGEHTGLEVNVPVSADQCGVWTNRADTVYSTFKTLPNFFGHKLKVKIPEVNRSYKVSNGVVNTVNYMHGGASVVQGQVSYRMDAAALQGRMSPEIFNFFRSVENHLVIEYDIGIVEIQASREALSYTEDTIKAIVITLTELMEVIQNEIQDTVKDQPSLWHASRYLLTERYDQSECPAVKRMKDWLIKSYKVIWMDKNGSGHSVTTNHYAFKFKRVLELGDKKRLNDVRRFTGKGYKPHIKNLIGPVDDKKLELTYDLALDAELYYNDAKLNISELSRFVMKSFVHQQSIVFNSKEALREFEEYIHAREPLVCTLTSSIKIDENLRKPEPKRKKHEYRTWTGSEFVLDDIDRQKYYFVTEETTGVMLLGGRRIQVKEFMKLVNIMSKLNIIDSASIVSVTPNQLKSLNEAYPKMIEIHKVLKKPWGKLSKEAQDGISQLISLNDATDRSSYVSLKHMLRADILLNMDNIQPEIKDFISTYRDKEIASLLRTAANSKLIGPNDVDLDPLYKIWEQIYSKDIQRNVDDPKALYRVIPIAKVLQTNYNSISAVSVNAGQLANYSVYQTARLKEQKSISHTLNGLTQEQLEAYINYDWEQYKASQSS